MPLADLTRPAVLAAIEEYDRLGREEFLRRYGFGPAREYRLLFNGRECDSKAIAGVAHQYTTSGAAPLTAAEFSGGRDTVTRTLEDQQALHADTGIRPA
jgi:5-methylcytosine-specific restriction protein A